jgi:hypothetical protein
MSVGSVGWGSEASNCLAAASGSSVSIGLSSLAGAWGSMRMPGTSVTKISLSACNSVATLVATSSMARLKASPVGEKPKGESKHHRAHVQRAHDAVHVHLAHQARVDEVHAIHNAHRPGGDEVARNHPHRGARHGGVGQALAERGFNFVAQLARSFLRAVEGHAVGDADAMGVLGRVAFGGQLLVDLGAKAMHQHDLHAHALDQRQVLRQVLQLARRNRFARDAHHKGLAPVHVDVRRHRPEPGHEGEIENGGHGLWGVLCGQCWGLG